MKYTRVRYILHVDADAFFASVEQALRPELKGLAVIVGGSDRGVVSAASYEARRFGVHSAMPMVQARRLCPHAIFLSPNFTAYRDFSDNMFDIMRKYSPMVEETSVDEGYVDLTGTLKLHKAPPWEIAHRILSEIRGTLEINVSGGLAGSKSAAKIATGLAKPNGLLYLEPDCAAKVMRSLSVGSIPGVGKRAQEVLQGQQIFTVADLFSPRGIAVCKRFGRWGEKILRIAAGIDTRAVSPAQMDERKSYSKDRTLEADTSDISFLWAVTVELMEKLAAKLRADGRGASTITFKVRYADFTDVSHSATIGWRTDSNRDIFTCLYKLFRKTIRGRTKVRQVGVKLSGLGPPALQTDLFEPSRPRDWQRDRVSDEIRRRFGFQAVQPAWTFGGSSRHGSL